MEELNPIVIESFSLGMYGSYHGGSGSPATTVSRMSNTRNGAATIENTWGCCADGNSGALVPLPARQSGPTVTLPGTATSPANYPAGKVEMRLLDGIVYPGDFNRDSPFVMYSWFYSPTGGGVGTYKSYLLGRYWTSDKASNLNPTWVPREWYYQNEGTVSGGPDTRTACVILDRGASQSEVVGIFPFPVIVAGLLLSPRPTPSTGISAALQSSPFATPTAIPANEQFAGITWGADHYIRGWVWAATTTPALRGVPSLFGMCVLWPGASDSGLTGAIPYPVAGVTPTGGNSPNYLVGHQGRMVIAADRSTSFTNILGGGHGEADFLVFTAPEDYYTVDPNNGVGNTTYLTENGGWAGTMATLNANDLFIVKHVGGGALIRGGLQDPTIIRLPSIESTGGVASKPTYAPGVGLVYGSIHGVYAFDGQSKTQCISPQIDGCFWRWFKTSDYNPLGSFARFGFHTPWVLAPNDFVFDTRTQSWWRLIDPATPNHAPYAAYDGGGRTGSFFAFPSKVTATKNISWDRFDPTILASAYSWQSQPLVESTTHVLSFTTFNMVAMAAPGSISPSITITFTGYDTDGTALDPVVEEWDLGPETQRPQFLERDIHPEFQGRYVQVRLKASSETGPAPAIMPGFQLFTRAERVVPRT